MKTAILFISIFMVLSGPVQGRDMTENQSRVSILLDAAQAIGALGEAIGKITEGVKKLVETSADGVDFVLARRTYSKLKDLSAESTQFAATQNAIVISNLDEYLMFPSETSWLEVKKELSTVLESGLVLLEEWKEERSDFVLEEAYEAIHRSLNARVGIIQRLSGLPAPMGAEQLKALEDVKTQYEELLSEFRNAIGALNVYMKGEKTE